MVIIICYHLPKFMKLSVIIPAYNEERNIQSTIKDIDQYLSSKSIEHEIIVVTDGSKDRTVEVVKELIPQMPPLQLIEEKINHGKGYSVKKGMLAATGDIRLFTDADNSTRINHIERMLPYLNQGYDVVIGSIAVKGHTVASGSEPIWRRLFGKLGNLYIQMLAVRGIHDTQRGFKVFTARAVEKIFPLLTIKRFGFDVEILALARKFGYKIKEMPVDWKNDPNSHVGLKVYLEVLRETAQVRWNLWTGQYK